MAHILSFVRITNDGFQSKNSIRAHHMLCIASLTICVMISRILLMHNIMIAKSMLFLNYCNSNKNTFWHKLIVLLARDDVLMACLFLYNSLNK